MDIISLKDIADVSYKKLKEINNVYSNKVNLTTIVISKINFRSLVRIVVYSTKVRITFMVKEDYYFLADVRLTVIMVWEESKLVESLVLFI